MSTQIQRFKRQGRHNFTLVEIEKMRDELAPLLSQASGAEGKIDGHKIAIKNLTNTVKHLRKEADELASLVETGWEERPISCFRFKSYDMRCFIYVSEDTAEEICREPFTLGDQQTRVDDMLWPAERHPPVPLWKAVADLKLDGIVYGVDDEAVDTPLNGAAEDEREPWEGVLWTWDQENKWHAAEINGTMLTIEENGQNLFTLTEQVFENNEGGVEWGSGIASFDEAAQLAWLLASKEDESEPGERKPWLYDSEKCVYTAYINGIGFHVAEDGDGNWHLHYLPDGYIDRYASLGDAQDAAHTIAGQQVEWLTPGEGYDGFENDLMYAEINDRRFTISKSNTATPNAFEVYERTETDPLKDPKVASSDTLEGAQQAAWNFAWDIPSNGELANEVQWNDASEFPDEINKGSKFWTDIKGVRFSIFFRKTSQDFGVFIGSRKGTKPDMTDTDLTVVRDWSENFALTGSGELWEKHFGGAE
jgi:hypothetical protein